MSQPFLFLTFFCSHRLKKTYSLTFAFGSACYSPFLWEGETAKAKDKKGCKAKERFKEKIRIKRGVG